MELRYDITAVGEQQLRAVIRGIEQEILGSNRRMTAQIRSGGGGGAGRPKAITSGQATSEETKLARARISEDAKVWREKERQAKRYAQIEIAEVERASEKRLAAIKKEEAARSKLIQKFGSGVASSVGGMARTAVSGVSMAGGIAIGSALHDQMQVQAYASRVANQGQRPELKGTLAAQAQNLKGFTGEEALSGLDQFIQKSGNLEAGMQVWQKMGQLALATSSDITELGQASGAAFNAISQDVKDPVEQIKVLNDVMKTLAVQGNIGSVEMRDFAVELPKIAAAAHRFGGNSGENIKMMGALTQLAVKRGGATDAAESATSVIRFTDDLIKDARAKKGKPGLDVFTDKTNTKMRDSGDIIADIMDKTGGDLTKIGGMFGMRGMKALSGVSGTYLDAYNAAEATKKGSGKAAGRAAIHSALDEFAGAKLTDKDLASRAQLRLDDPDLQVKEAVKQFNVAIGTQLMPVLVRLIPQFTALVPQVADVTSELVSFVQFMSQNPYAGLGAIVGAKVASDIGKALAAAGLKKILQTSVGQSFAGGLMIGTATLTVMELFMAKKEMDANKRITAMNQNAEDIRTQARQEMQENGTISPETRKRLEASEERDKKRLAGKFFDDPLEGVGVARQSLNTLTGGLFGPTIFNDKSVTATTDASRASEIGDSKAKTEALLAQDDAAKKLAAAADKLAAAGDKLAASDPARTKPIVGR